MNWQSRLYAEVGSDFNQAWFAGSKTIAPRPGSIVYELLDISRERARWFKPAQVQEFLWYMWEQRLYVEYFKFLDQAMKRRYYSVSYEEHNFWAWELGIEGQLIANSPSFSPPRFKIYNDEIDQ